MSNALASVEASALAEHERTIEHGLKSFVEVGVAFAHIRDGRLYRETHRTFEDYVRERWDRGRSYANRLIAAAGIVQELVPMGTTPTSERVARPLRELPSSEERLTAWKRAEQRAGGGRVTERHVQSEVDKLRPKKSLVDEKLIAKQALAKLIARFLKGIPTTWWPEIARQLRGIADLAEKKRKSHLSAIRHRWH